MFEQSFKNIDDVLWKEAGCTTELDYTEQASWLPFLKYLDGLGQDKAAEAVLEGRQYGYILDEPYRWESGAVPKGADGKLDHRAALTRKKLLEGLAEKGFGKDHLTEMQKIIDAEKSDLFDVLAHVAYALEPLTREEGADRAMAVISKNFNPRLRVFLDSVLSQYGVVGVEDLDRAKQTPLLKLNYRDSIADTVAALGKPDEIGKVFSGFQRYLYVAPAAPAK